MAKRLSALEDWAKPIAIQVDALIHKFGIARFRHNVEMWLLEFQTPEGRAAVLPLPLPKQRNPSFTEKVTVLCAIRDEFCKGELVVDEKDCECATEAEYVAKCLSETKLVGSYFALRSRIRDANFIVSEYHDEEVLSFDPQIELAKLRHFVRDVETALVNSESGVVVGNINRVSISPTEHDGKPKIYLIGWPEILAALEKKNNASEKTLVASFNEKYEGPITNAGQGSKPKVEKTKLIEWWNHLEIEFESENRNRDAMESVSQTYQHGRDGEVVPGIVGAVRRRR